MKHTIGGLEVTAEYGRDPGLVNGVTQFVARVTFDVEGGKVSELYEKASRSAAEIAALDGLDRVWYSLSDIVEVFEGSFEAKARIALILAKDLT